MTDNMIKTLYKKLGPKELDLDKFLELACLGQIDGGHHKTWVIDQMVNLILGDAAYSEFLYNYEYGEFEDAQKTNPDVDPDDYVYQWDQGIPP